MAEQSELSAAGHARWVRACHWILAASVLTLACSGFVILMAHPRLYWGAVGNDLTPAWLELPIGRNYHHAGWEAPLAFYSRANSPVTAVRTYEIFNQNGWARSLHFLAAWFLVSSALVYWIAGVLSGHLRRDLAPRASELRPRLLWNDVRSHLRRAAGPAAVGPPYNLLQKCSYFAVMVLAVPLLVISGLTMSPAMTAALPWLLDLFGGQQSARTIHFLCFALLVLFVVIHVAMVFASGFRRQIRAMTVGT